MLRRRKKGSKRKRGKSGGRRRGGQREKAGEREEEDGRKGSEKNIREGEGSKDPCSLMLVRMLGRGGVEWQEEGCPCRRICCLFER